MKSLGGKIKIAKMEIPGFDWFALAFDPEGNTLGILST
jgi:predicted enzyme related to lactoylglutathione lyase